MKCIYWSKDEGENYAYCHWEPLRGDVAAPCEDENED